jgi:Gamma-glutamyl cyclotransferase, AIG2-like
MTHRVFVYGTLKSGFPNHSLLKGCEFFGDAATVPTYKMIENGFPVMSDDRSSWERGNMEPAESGLPSFGPIYLSKRRAWMEVTRRKSACLPFDSFYRGAS